MDADKDSVIEEVAIEYLSPNMFRLLLGIPPCEEKIEALVSSIKKDGFWGSLVARKVKLHYELAYGFHRLLALKRVYGANSKYKVKVCVGDYSDDQMLRMMINENATQRNKGRWLEEFEAIRLVKEWLESKQIAEAILHDKELRTKLERSGIDIKAIENIPQDKLTWILFWHRDIKEVGADCEEDAVSKTEEGAETVSA